MGYARAGFEVVGVDHVAQPHYPFEFRQADALAVLDMLVSGECLDLGVDGYWLEHFDVIHASPPCQASSPLRAMWPSRNYPELIPSTRDLLRASRLPYVIENVAGSALARHPQLDGVWGIELCGSMFGLGTTTHYLRRHRWFEMSVPVPQPACAHKGLAGGVYGHGGNSTKHRMLNAAHAAQAMGIDWMNRDEMAQAIPPAYTEFIGRFLYERIGATA